MDYLPSLTEDRGPGFLKANWIGVGFGVLFVGARIFTRLRVLRHLSLDDYLMLTSLILGIVSASLSIVAVDAGFGKHVEALQPDQIMKALKYQYIIQPFAYLALVFGRVSFAFSLIFLMGINKTRRWALYALITGQFVLNLIWIGLSLGQCDPPEKYWNRRLPGQCMDPMIQGNAGYVSQSFNIFTDFVLALFPALVISNLNMRLRTKVGLIFLMGLGIFNMAAAIVTIVEISKIGGGMDVTYDFIPLDIWGIVQTYLAMVLASIPFIRPLFRDVKTPHMFSWTFYHSIFRRYSRGSNPSSSPWDNEEKSVLPTSEKSRFYLPRIGRSRFATTTLRNMGVEDEATLVERGDKLRDLEAVHVDDRMATKRHKAEASLENRGSRDVNDPMYYIQGSSHPL